jgi:hypothetical protein
MLAKLPFKLFLITLISIFLNSNSNVKAEVMNGFKEYTIKQGDTLGKIAPPETWDFIMRVNKLDAGHFTPGKTVLIPNDPEEIPYFCPVPEENGQAEADERVVYVYLDVQYFGAYECGKLIFWGPICSGKPGRETPQGCYRALWKAKSHFSKKYAATMPYAVCISEDGYFLHQQSIVGKPASHGCVRLLKCDAKKIFSWINKGDAIIITNLNK